MLPQPGMPAVVPWLLPLVYLTLTFLLGPCSGEPSTLQRSNEGPAGYD